MLRVYSIDQDNEWDRIVKSFSKHDVYYLSGYVKAFRLQPNYGVMCFDVQKLFSEHFEEGKSQIGLQDAIKKMHLERYTAHNAFNDAYSTAEILSKLMITPQKTRTINKIIECDDVLYIDEECSSKSDAIKRAKESKITCSCGAQANMGHMIRLGKSKVIAGSQCACGKEYFIVVKTLKSKSSDQINLQCYKWIMSEELKTFYLKQKKIDDAIMEYAEKHNRKNKK